MKDTFQISVIYASVSFAKATGSFNVVDNKEKNRTDVGSKRFKGQSHDKSALQRVK
jgi:hypothetical protein